MKKGHHAAEGTPAARGPAFFQLCGSPIRTDAKLTYEDDEREESRPPESPQTPPVGSRRPPRTQAVVTESPRFLRDGEEESKEEQDAGTRAAAAVVTCDAQAYELENQKTAPVSLAKAKEAGIPYFVSYESKTDFPSTDAGTSATRAPLTLIQIRELQFGRIIGEGAFGRVYMARWKGKKVAVKMLIRQNLSEEVVREFETEAKIMSYLHHPNICQLLGACLEPCRRALVVELLERGCLWNVLQSERRHLTTGMRAKMVMDIARGMHYLHNFERPILHRDMKSPNLLVEKDFTIKISDFGLARVKAQIQTMTGNCGTVQWMAPEVLGNRKYTEKADVYSFAIVVWEIFTGRCPYDGMTQIQAALSVLNHDLRPSIPSSCPAFFARLMKMCWARDPEARPSFDFIVRMYEQHERAREDARERRLQHEARAKLETKPRPWKP